MNIRLFFYFVCFFLLERGYGQVKSSDVPVIRLCPEEAQTLKMSELFTGYRVMSLKGCSYTSVKNILERDGRFIALCEISFGNNYIVEFDKSGKFSYISKFHILISYKLTIYIVMCFYQGTN